MNFLTTLLNLPLWLRVNSDGELKVAVFAFYFFSVVGILIKGAPKGDLVARLMSSYTTNRRICRNSEQKYFVRIGFGSIMRHPPLLVYEDVKCGTRSNRVGDFSKASQVGLFM